MKVKVLLSIILLVFYDSSVFSTPIRSKRNVDYTYVEQINEFRALLQDRMNTRMYELEWDEGLVALTKSMPKNCEEWKHGVNYRVIPEDPNDEAMEAVAWFIIGIALLAEWKSQLPPEEAAKFEEEFKNEFMKGAEKESLLIFEYMTPGQSRIGCGPAACTTAVDGRVYAFSSVCFIGPVRNLDKDETSFCAATGKNPKLCKDPSPPRQWTPDRSTSGGLNIKSMDDLKKKVPVEFQNIQTPKGQNLLSAKDELARSFDKKSSGGAKSVITLSVLMTFLIFIL